ncbi:ABC transporter substrate-binding protein [Cutibacterium porci]
MSPSRIHRTRLSAALAGLCILTMAACAGSSTEGPTTSTTGRSVMSCQEKLTFTDPPKRVIMMGDTDASTMNALGVLDHVVARAGQIKEGAYDAKTLAKLKAIPTIASQQLNTGGVKVSTETILEHHADLVIGYDTGVDRNALRKSGVKMYSTDAMCTDKKPPAPATFSQVKDEVDKVGQIFNVPDKANHVNKDLEKKIATIEKETSSGAKADAVALYITPGSTEFYTYGSSSMIEPMFAATGLRNMYHSNTTRVSDATMEDLLHKNPEWIVLLAGDGAMSQVEPTFLSFKGAKELKAVKNGHVVTMSFALTDPPTPLTITGTEKLHDLVQDKKRQH